MLNLQRHGYDPCVSQQVQYQGALEVGYANGFGKAFVDKLFHCFPGFGNACFSGRDFLAAFIFPAGGIPSLWIDVLQRDGEVHDVQVPVVEACVFELLFAYRLDSLLVMEGVPEFGDEEEVFSLYKTVPDGAADTLSCFLFISVVTVKDG